MNDRTPIPSLPTAAAPRQTPWAALVSLVMAILYGVSPIDLIPDILLLVGWVDDALVVPFLLLVAFSLWRRRKRGAEMGVRS